MSDDMDDMEELDKADREFKEKAFDIAFGEDAINRDFTNEEVLAKLQEFCDHTVKENGDSALASDNPKPNPKMTIEFTESDLQELTEGKTFDWTFPTDEGVDIDIHLYNEDAE